MAAFFRTPPYCFMKQDRLQNKLSIWGQASLPTMKCRASIFTVLLTIGLFVFFGCSKREPAPPARSATPNFALLSSEDIARLEQQRAIVAAAAKQRYGTPGLTKTKADLPVLQRLVDDKVFARNQTYELQSLGVALGDVMASELPLHWVMVTDKYGTDLTLRFKETTLQINALTMISKRLERDEAVNVARLLAITREQLAYYQKELEK
jgi:hypothetical protein